MSVAYLPQPATAPDWTTAVDAFLTERDLLPRTVRSYRGTLDALGEAGGLAGRRVDELDARALHAVLRTRYDTAAPATWNRAAATLGAFLRWCWRQDWVGEDVLATYGRLVEHRRDRSDTRRAVPYARLERLWTGKDVPLRERTLWRLLYDTAARAEEVLQLDVEDLDQPNRTARTIRKGGKPAVLVWGDDTARLLARLLRGRTSGPVFTTTPRALTGRGIAAADIAPTGHARLSYRRAAATFSARSGGLTLHQLRHSAIVDLLEAGYPTPLVMAKSGHESLRAFQRYARPSDNAVARMTTEHARRRSDRT